MSYGQPLQPQDSIPQFTAFDLPVDLPLALTDGLFDATAASSEQLVRLGLPPRPDARRQPLLRQAWNRAFSRPVKVEPFAPAPDPIKFRTSVRRLNVLRVSQTRFEGSRNWSGAYITANRRRHLLQVPAEEIVSSDWSAHWRPEGGFEAEGATKKPGAPGPRKAATPAPKKRVPR